jgi:hypothetical protein
MVLADPSHVRVGPSFPEQKISGRITTIEGVKKIPNIYVGPYKWSLNIGQSDFSEANILYKRNQRISCCRKESHRNILFYVDRNKLLALVEEARGWDIALERVEAAFPIFGLAHHAEGAALVSR